MALINCPECKKEVSDSAKTCPHCGYKLIEDEVQKTNIQSKKPKKKSGCLTLVIIGAALLIIFYIFYIIGSNGDNSPLSNSTSANKFLAYNYAEDFVEKKLKSPSTAEFPGVTEKDKHITDLGGGKYKINSWVDSQNGFGATIRTNFSCTIVFEGDKVRCENLIFE